MKTLAAQKTKEQQQTKITDTNFFTKLIQDETNIIPIFHLQSSNGELVPPTINFNEPTSDICALHYLATHQTIHSL